ncbi:MAG: arylamine N-acetyltransferase [Terriglobus roseus]|nr:arylamine N-acetyltransferase [Terriglobus roseus]
MAPLTYDADQIQRYYDRIKLPSARRVLTVDGLDPETSLAYLKLLQQHHLVAIPFESLSLHYGPHTVSLHPDALFRKVVCSNGRGGYCMENNFLFGTLLRSVGYTLYPAGARVMHSPEYTGCETACRLLPLSHNRRCTDA